MEKHVMCSKRLRKGIQHNWRLYILMLPALLWLVVFAYYPMYGLLIAFKDFKAVAGILGSPWADPVWKHFADFFSTSVARMVISNTLVLSLLTILISFPVPIIFALLLNQVKGKGTRKFIQTVSYAPYFISNVVVVSIMNVICAPGGFVNTIIKSLTGHPLLLMSSAEYFRTMYPIYGRQWDFRRLSILQRWPESIPIITKRLLWTGQASSKEYYILIFL